MNIPGREYGLRALAGGVRRLVRDRWPREMRRGLTTAALPSRLSVDVTYRCGGGCRICCQSGANTARFPGTPRSPAFVDPALVDRVAAEVARVAPTFYLTGGEPLLHPEIVAIVRAIKRRGLYCSLNTNGAHLAALAPSLAAAGLDKLIVSVDVSAGHFEAGRAIPYATLREAVRAVAAAGRPRLALNCVISPWNYRDLWGIRDVARDLCVFNVSLQHLMYSNPARVFDHGRVLGEEFGETAEYRNLVADTFAIDASVLVAGIDRLLADPGPLRLRVTPSLPGDVVARYYSGADVPIGGACAAPWNAAVITPAGDLSLCPPLRAGSLREHSLAALWNGPAAQALRRRLLAHGPLPDCARCCTRSFS